jgi:polyphenol oxidase
MLTCLQLSAVKKIRHGFFTRHGGVSEGIYASLNCGPGSGDAIEKVLTNRGHVAKALSVEGDALCTAYQIHSPQVVVLDKPWTWQSAPKADALVTATPGIAIGILTADCLPILFADKEKRIIGAAHAGWKGAFDGVIEATVQTMQRLGAGDIIATIGPGIGQMSYEIGPEFHARFLQKDIENADYFMLSPKAGHQLFDLAGYARKRLERAGVTAINLLARDTCLQENDFFSFRRATLRNEKAYGRQISAIVLEK